jgi:hypothetical protein
MKTVIVLYLPGHAGNFVARLFSLGQETMPLLPKTMLLSCITSAQDVPQDFDRLENYRFSDVPKKFNDWQKFHRSFADYNECNQYRLWNSFCKQKYSRIVFPIHPREFGIYFVQKSLTEFYFVDLDLDRWGHWVDDQQQKLDFEYRHDELEQFQEFKKSHHMAPISLDRLLESTESFVHEYQRVCELMLIPTHAEQALQLRQDWMSVRCQ